MKIFRCLKKASGIILTALLSVLIALNIYIMICGIREKPAFIGGVCILKIITPSMTPTLKTGDFIIVKKVSPESLQKGDIISFYSEDSEIYGKINTHRIAGITSGEFITRGDANPADDSTPVRKENIIGKYSGKIKFLKWVGSFANSKKLLMLCVIIPTLATAVYEVITISKIKTECDEERMRSAIEKEKKRLYEENYAVSEVKEFESGKNNEKENVHSNIN
ncbi:MAG: signal peptidase I [Oscillospiraceae bacterium]|nr:signal peptidase I [Oscillospiraceae bacterium]